MEFSRSFMSVHSHFHEISPSTRNSQLNCISHFFPIYKKFDLQKILNWLHHTVVYSCLLGELLEGHKFFPNFFPMSTLFFFSKREFFPINTLIFSKYSLISFPPLSLLFLKGERAEGAVQAEREHFGSKNSMKKLLYDRSF